MNIRSLLLGSVATAGLASAGLATGAHAADLGVLTSLDVCDNLGLSGLTLSSETNCLQITGGVNYEFVYGDYEGAGVIADTPREVFDIPNNDAASDYIVADDPATVDVDESGGITEALADEAEDATQDWDSTLEAWLRVVGTADSDFGPAKAVIKLRQVTESDVDNEGIFEGTGFSYEGDADIDSDDSTDGDDNNPDNARVILDEAYVSIGDSTVIMAGKKSSVANFGDDEPFNFLGLFNSSKVDAGVGWDYDGGEDEDAGDNNQNSVRNLDVGGTVIQVTTDLGNGFSASAGLENLQDADVFSDDDLVAEGAAYAGTLVGVLAYTGEGISAHVTGVAGGVLDGEVENYAMHAGFTGTFDNFKVRGAFAANNTGWWNALASASATVDLFEIAVSGEATHGDINNPDEMGFGVGGSIGYQVSDGVKLNLGGRYFDNDTEDDETGGGYQVAAQLVAAVTETLTLTGEVGVYGVTDGNISFSGDDEDDTSSVFYGQAMAAWAPGGGFTSSLTGTAYSDGAYKATFKAGKTFE